MVLRHGEQPVGHYAGHGLVDHRLWFGELWEPASSASISR